MEKLFNMQNTASNLQGYEKTRMQITKIREIKAVQHYLTNTEEPGYRIDETLRSLVAPLRGAGGFVHAFSMVSDVSGNSRMLQNQRLRANTRRRTPPLRKSGSVSFCVRVVRASERARRSCVGV